MRHPDLPSAEQLLAAVQTFLRDKIAAQLEGAEAYHLRVALHTLATVERELAATAEWQRVRESLQELLRQLPQSHTAVAQGAAQDDRAELCEHIRSGALAADNPQLLAWLKADALARVAVDNPRYSTYLHLKERESR